MRGRDEQLFFLIRRYAGEGSSVPSNYAGLVAELVEERIANGNTEFSQAKAWDGNNEDYAFSVAIDALKFWLEGNSGNFDDIREWTDGFSRETDCPGTLEFEARRNPDDNHLQ
jgi:hypothetical protein